MPEVSNNDALYIRLSRERYELNLQVNELYEVLRVITGSNYRFDEINLAFDTVNPKHPVLKKVAYAFDELSLYFDEISAAYTEACNRRDKLNKLIKAWQEGQDIIQVKLTMGFDDE